MTDPMPYRCPAIEPGFGVLERCVFHVGHGGYHLASGAWPVEETTRRCAAAGAITGGRCVLPGGHDEDDGTVHLFAVPGGSAQAVEWSTPIASPAPASEAIVHRCPPSGSSVMPCCGRTPFEVPGDRITVDPALVTCAAPAGEVVSVTEGWTRGLGESQDWENGDVVVSVPPPGKIDSREALTRHAVDYAKEYGHWRLEADAAVRKLDADAADLHIGCAGDALDSLRQKLDELYELGAASRPALADEPVPVPPPVAALLNLVDDLHSAVRDDDGTEIDRARGNIVMAARDLWAAGVEEGRRQPLVVKSMAQALDLDVDELYAAGVAEGRRQRDAEIHANVFTSARLAAAEAGFGPAPESVTVSYDVTTDPQTAFDLGVAEGRRQATEERTEEVERLQALLDHVEQYARDLQDGGYVPLAMDEADYAEETAERADG